GYEDYAIGYSNLYTRQFPGKEGACSGINKWKHGIKWSAGVGGVYSWEVDKHLGVVAFSDHTEEEALELVTYACLQNPKCNYIDFNKANKTGYLHETCGDKPFIGDSRTNNPNTDGNAYTSSYPSTAYRLDRSSTSSYSRLFPNKRGGCKSDKFSEIVIYPNKTVNSVDECANECEKNKSCRYFSWVPNYSQMSVAAVAARNSKNLCQLFKSECDDSRKDFPAITFKLNSTGSEKKTKEMFSTNLVAKHFGSNGECWPNPNESSNFGPGLTIDQCAQKCFEDKNCNYIDFDEGDGDCWTQPDCMTQDSDHYSAFRIDGNSNWYWGNRGEKIFTYKRHFPNQRGECLPNSGQKSKGVVNDIEACFDICNKNGYNYFDYDPVTKNCWIQQSCESRDKTDGYLAFKLTKAPTPEITTVNNRPTQNTRIGASKTKKYYVACSYGDPGCTSQGKATISESFDLKPNQKYTIKIEVLQSDMGDAGEKLESVKLNGINLGECKPSGSDDYACSFYTCFEKKHVKTGSDGKLLVEVTSIGMSNDCYCDNSGDYYGFDGSNRDGNYVNYGCVRETLAAPSWQIPMGLVVHVTPTEGWH
ncbi:MAG: PAN domain-containing protein, partial [Candidatus Marinimicrobia bacterium]|nr:PAN domain-containing protein [Candidatus Neomarinimicrobiota bacterium]